MTTLNTSRIIFNLYAKRLVANHGTMLEHIGSLTEEERYDALHSEIMGKHKTLRYIRSLVNAEVKSHYPRWLELSDDSELSNEELKSTYLYYLTTQDPEFSIDLRNERRKFINDREMMSIVDNMTGLRLPKNNVSASNALYDYAMIISELDTLAASSNARAGTCTDRPMTPMRVHEAIHSLSIAGTLSSAIPLPLKRHFNKDMSYFEIDKSKLSKVKCRLEGSFATVKKGTDKMIGRPHNKGHTFVIKDIHFVIVNEKPEGSLIEADDIRIVRKSLHATMGIPGKNLAPCMVILFGDSDLIVKSTTAEVEENYLVLVEYVLGLREISDVPTDSAFGKARSRFTNKRLLPYFDFYARCI